MKRLSELKMLLLVATIFTVSMTGSAEGRIAVAPYMNTNYAVVSAIPAESGFYSVLILDRTGDVVFASNRFESTESFVRLFNFSRLADGDYRVRLRSRKGVESEAVFSLVGGKLKMDSPSKSNSEESIAKIWTSSEYLFVSHLNKDLKSSALRVTDSKGNLIYSGSLPADLTYSGKFNISALPFGEYAVSLISGDKVYNYGFRK